MLCIQETKKEQIDKTMCQALWGDSEVSWDIQPATNTAGGLLCLGNEQAFKVERRVNERGFILLEGTWIHETQTIFIVNIYAPCDIQSKRALWDSVRQLKNLSPDGLWCLLGDFNNIRHPFERGGVSQRGEDVNTINEFNDWITDIEVEEIPSVRRKLTWFRPNGVAKSKLDRFFVSHEWLNKWPGCTQFILDRNFSDHCPILLRSKNIDWGPKPFRVLDYWLKDKSFENIVNKCWTNTQPKG